MKNRICVVGAGPAGVMAAYAAAQKGNDVILFDKNEKIGKKLYITGKGRCNVTNSADIETFIQNTQRNAKFLYSALYTFSNDNLAELFRQNGLSLKTERGGRMFPESDKSSDVIKVMQKLLSKAGVTVKLGTKVERILTEKGAVCGVVAGGERYECDGVILAAGGASYPLTGSTGDGYAFARAMGHHVTDIYPSLVPLTSEDGDIRALQGVSLKNVTFTLYQGSKRIFSDFGEMLFTHFGVSGPLVLSASAKIDFKSGAPLNGEIDLKPALSEQTLDNRILRDFTDNINKTLQNALGGLLLSSLIPLALKRSGLEGTKRVNSVTAEERLRLAKTVKALTFDISGTRPIEEAIITRGGVDVKEVDASTLRSKLVRGLSFAGEMLNVDALTGGYNLQIAFSTGYLAGLSILEE